MIEKKKNFNIEYRRVKRANRIEKIEHNEKVSITWTNTDTSVYTTLLSMHRAYGDFNASYEYLAGECNLCAKTIGNSLRKMRDFGIVVIKQDNKRKGGCFVANLFTYVVDLEESNKFKCITNKYKKAYDKKKRDRVKRLQYIQGVVIQDTWIEAQCRNYWRNTNYELITGEYLTGDKTEKLLFSYNKGFNASEDLKQYETEGLYKKRYN